VIHGVVIDGFIFKHRILECGWSGKKESHSFVATDFVTEAEGSCLKPNSLIIDISCDEGMGFFFAKPTTFKNPMFKYETIDYYAVDHTPSYLWESATRSISAALIVFVPTVLAGRDSWQQNETIRRAINIDGGVIQNPSILSFQKREPDYPHAHFNPVGELDA
jgi:N5-(carboxyethyl)ornithine synthase